MSRRKPQPPVHRDLVRHLLVVAGAAFLWRLAAWALLSP